MNSKCQDVYYCHTYILAVTAYLSFILWFASEFATPMISSGGVFRVATNSIFVSRDFIYSLTSGCCSLIYSLFENNLCKNLSTYWQTALTSFGCEQLVIFYYSLLLEYFDRKCHIIYNRKDKQLFNISFKARWDGKRRFVSHVWMVTFSLSYRYPC